MKEILKLGGILLLIGAICSGLVGYVNEITKEPIAKQEQETKAIAMKEVLPSAESFQDAPAGEDVLEAYTGIQGGQIIGYTVKVAPKAYGGAMEMMVGITSDGVVQGIKILSHSETPGLGANASDVSFTDQFKNKVKGLKVVKGTSQSEDEISAITGATITSKAVADGVNMALEYVESQEGGAQ